MSPVYHGHSCGGIPSAVGRLVGIGMSRKLLNRASSQVGQVALSSVDHVITTRLPQAQALIERLRADQPHATAAQVADSVIRKFARELAAAGAASGAIAAAPAVGTTASLATSVADIGLAFARLTEMVMGVGLAYGHNLDDLATRKRWVHHVLSGASGNLTDVERKAGDLKKQLGKTAIATKSPAATTARLGEKVATKAVGRLAARGSAVKLASLLPLGIGAGVGAAGNRALVNSVGRTAKTFFGTQEPKEASKYLELG